MHLKVIGIEGQEEDLGNGILFAEDAVAALTENTPTTFALAEAWSMEEVDSDTRSMIAIETWIGDGFSGMRQEAVLCIEITHPDHDHCLEKGGLYRME